MSEMIPGNTTYGIWLRCPTSSGGKDWLGFVTDQAVISRWGPTGRVRQTTRLADRPSGADLQRKIDEKLRKGYAIVSLTHGDGWVSPGTPAGTPKRTLQSVNSKGALAVATLSEWTKECEQTWF
jgi:hypothetical protein